MRRPGKLYDVDLDWSAWTKVAPEELSGGGDVSDEQSADGSTRPQYTGERDFNKRGAEYGLAVRVRNRVGWSSWSYI